MAGAKAKVLDFSGVKDGGGNFRPRRRAEGDYYAHVAAVSDHTSKEGNEGWVFTIKIDGDSRATYPYYCNFEDNQLWKSRNLCIAAGIKVPSGRAKLDPNKLVGRPLGVALVDDEYEGRVKSTIDAVIPLDDIEDARNEKGKASSVKAKSRKADDEDDEDEDDDEDEKPAKGKAKTSKKRQSEPDDDDEEDEEDEEDEDEPPTKKGKASKKSKRRDDDEDEDEDDEDDEPPAKSKSKKDKGKGKSKKSREDDEDDELDIDDL
jgi:hypothetical protein